MNTLATPPDDDALGARVLGWLRGQVAAGIDVKLDSDFVSLGIDSMSFLALAGELEEWVGARCPLDLLFDVSTPLELLARVRAAVAAETDGDRAASEFERWVNPDLGHRLSTLHLDAKFVRGEGVWLWDAEGRRTLDFLSNYGALPFGSNPDDVWDALVAVRERREPSMVQPSALWGAGELARRLIELAPPGVRTVTFTNSGAETVEAAIKMARSATGRARILTADGGFHGKTLGALAATANPDCRRPFGPEAPGFERIPFADLKALERTLEASRGAYAAFLVEPLQAEGGVVEAPDGYLEAAQDLCRRHGTLFAVDEIQTGLGRTGSLFAWPGRQAPDLLLLAKALGGGLVPIGACLAGTAAASRDFGLQHSSTFAGNALAARAGLAVLDRLVRDDGALLAHVQRCGARLRLGLEQLQKAHSEVVASVRGAGFLLGVELRAPRRDSPLLRQLAEQRFLAALASAYLLNAQGVRTAPALSHGNVLRVEPPLVAEWDHCEHFLGALDRFLGVFERGGLGELHAAIAGREVPRTQVAVSRSWREPSPREGDERFAFVVHPLDPASLVDFDSSLAGLDDEGLDELAEAATETLAPFVGSRTRITSATGASAAGDFIAIAATARAFTRLPRSRAVAMVREAVMLARERGASLVGLGAFTSIVTRGGLEVADLGVAVTNGNAFTVAASIEAVDACVERERGWSGRCAAVVGASGVIGHAATRLLAARAERLMLVGRPALGGTDPRRRLLAVAADVVADAGDARAVASAAPASLLARLAATDGRPASDADLSERMAFVADTGAVSGAFVFADRPDTVLPFADVVIAASSAADPVIAADPLRAGAIVCDVARPRDVRADVAARRPDVVLIDGGLIEIPGRPKIGDYGLPPGTALACMAETMLLSLEGRAESFSVGGRLDLERVLEIGVLARRHGFRPVLPPQLPNLQRGDEGHGRSLPG